MCLPLSFHFLAVTIPLRSRRSSENHKKNENVPLTLNKVNRILRKDIKTSEYFIMSARASRFFPEREMKSTDLYSHANYKQTLLEFSIRDVFSFSASPLPDGPRRRFPKTATTRQSLTRWRGYIKFFRGVCVTIFGLEKSIKIRIPHQSVANANADEKNKFRDKAERMSEWQMRART